MNDSRPDPDQVPEQAEAPPPGAADAPSAAAAEVPEAAEALAGPSYEPVAPALGVPRTPTGHPDVDAGLDRLADVDHLTADGHIEVYEDVHRGLRDTLTALDVRPTP
ncbi:hypothetical protein [Streptomyces sp. NPDC046821]|uniref:hypothetical protein n=1 Tax=Streptomyces sp. NPDC046821 TaxID=3154702 RepID=UPI00340A5AD7